MKLSRRIFGKVFVDEVGNYTGFKWWIKWNIAYWHLKKWLHYEGMPEDVKDFQEVLYWEKRIAGLKRTKEREAIIDEIRGMELDQKKTEGMGRYETIQWVRFEIINKLKNK